MATIKVKQIKSRINAPIDQKRTLLALGLRKICLLYTSPSPRDA